MAKIAHGQQIFPPSIELVHQTEIGGRGVI